MMCERALSRDDAGQPARREAVRPGLHRRLVRPAQQFRLLVLYTAWSIDKHKDYRKVRKDIAAVKVVMPEVLHDIAQRALQIHGALGVDQRDAVPPDGPRRERHGPRRRADRGAQGHRGPPGAAGLPPSEDLWPTEHIPGAWRRRGPSSPSTSSTKWGTSDRSRPRPRPGAPRPPRPGRRDWAEPIEHRLHLRWQPERDLRDPSRRPALRHANPATTAPAARDKGICGSGTSSRPRRHRRAPHRGRRRLHRPSVLGRAFYLMGFVDGGRR